MTVALIVQLTPRTTFIFRLLPALQIYISFFITQVNNLNETILENKNSSNAMILAVMELKIVSITARIIALLDFISVVPYMVHFIYHFVH